MRYENQKIESQTLNLDEDEFFNCELVNCVFTWSAMRAPVMRNCTSRKPQMRFEGAAALTAEMLKMMLQRPEMRTSALSALGLDKRTLKGWH